MLDIGILIYDDTEELDLAGPWEVFGMANRTAVALGMPPFCKLHLVAENATRPVTCFMGLRVLPTCSVDECNALDVLVVTGGVGSQREIYNQKLLDWIARISRYAQWVTSVCSGSELLCAAGPGKGRKVTNHWSLIKAQRAKGTAGEVVSDARFVCDGNVVSAAGVSAGIDMSLWLVGQLISPEFARRVQHAIQYVPEVPPYAAKG